MGQNNKQRRAASKRRKQRAARTDAPPRDRSPGRGHDPGDGRARARTGGEGRRARGGAGSAGRPPPPPSVEELLAAAVEGWRVDKSLFEAAFASLREQADAAEQAAESLFATEVAHQWAEGWTPTDLLHVIGREFTPDHVAVATEQVLAAGGRDRQRGPLHPRWEEQLSGLEDRGDARARPSPQVRLRLLVDVLGLLVRLVPVTPIMPPPWSAGADGVAGGGRHLDARMLARVQALLAKAESTPFEHEAEAFTAKAQELIARHAIDEALLHTPDDVGEPSVRRLRIDDPYADAKSQLVSEIAVANRCRVVYTPAFGWSTAFGYDHDLDALELLTASLLAQGTRAMLRHGSQRDAYGRSRTRSFRRAFLLGFAQRIGERLRQATDDEVAATHHADSRLLPVLAARDDRLRAAEERAFPHLVRRSASVSNAIGWSAGQVAAELASLEVRSRRLSPG